MADGAAGRGRDDERQRPRPERRGEGASGRVERALRERRLGAGDVRDQWIEPGPLLRRVDAGDGLRARRVAAEPIDRFGREGDESAVVQQFGRASEAGGVGGKALGVSTRRHERSPRAGRGKGRKVGAPA
jgi:hypothetical protein